MRFDGKLKKWDDERGFGFIEPTQGGDEVFVHILSFPMDGSRPSLDEPLSFEIEPNGEGKKKAVNVRRPAGAVVATRRRPERKASRRRRGGSPVRTFLLAAALGFGAWAYAEFARRPVAPAMDSAPQSVAGREAVASPPTPAGMRCDGRTHCSQMTSCTEAKFFLRNCPGVRMDGNHDGVPCEQQWCTSPLAK
jgi:cold shock CspA family protein